MRKAFAATLAVTLLGGMVSPVLGQVVVRPGVKVQPVPIKVQPPRIANLPNMVLINDKGVQEELRLTKEQTEKLSGFADKQKMAFQNIKGDPMGLKKYQEAVADLKKEMDTLLTPAQAKRLRQLELQQRGAMSLFDAQVAKDLNLTIQQRQQVGMAIQGQFQKLALSLKDAKGNVDDINKKVAEVQKNALEDAVKALTPEQQSKWKEMAGEPYKGTLPGGMGSPLLRPQPGIRIQPLQPRQVQNSPFLKPRD